MPKYRINFLDEQGAIRGRDQFQCDNDVAALLVATKLVDACGEVYHGYELWCAARRVLPISVSVRGGMGSAVRRDLARSVQEIVLERERVLLDSQGAVAQSQKLVAATNKLLADLARRTDRRRVRARPRDA
jgi:hypothetical protein